MPQNTQNRGNLTRVASNRHKQLFVTGQRPDLVERAQRTRILAGAAFASDAGPLLVALGETMLDTEIRPGSMDSGLVPAAVAGMNRNALAQVLEDEWAFGFGLVEPEKGRVVGLQAARQWAYKVCIGRVDAFDSKA